MCGKTILLTGNLASTGFEPGNIEFLYRILYTGHRYSTQLAINHRITKLIACYQKPEVWYYDMVPPFHKTLELVLPNLSLCQMHDYIINCHDLLRSGVSCNFSNCGFFKMTFKDIKLSLQVITHDILNKNVYLHRFSYNGIRRSCVKIEIITQFGQTGTACRVHWLF